jgi:oligopeptide transport system ATP-binding protein
VDLLNLPTGCAFASRCDCAMKVCLHEQPEEIFVAKDHLAACWMNVKAVYDEAAKTTTGGDNK